MSSVTSQEVKDLKSVAPLPEVQSESSPSQVTVMNESNLSDEIAFLEALGEWDEQDSAAVDNLMESSLDDFEMFLESDEIPAEFFAELPIKS
jgi:hypothetical protein